MLKAGGEFLIETMALTFSDLLSGRLVHPTAWKQSRLSIFVKNGDCHLLKNYRPISIIPVMAKLYSIILLARIQGAIESNQIDTQ